jgi:hypothetical protein
VTLAGTEGRQVTLLRSQIDSLWGTAKSLMPEGLEQDLPPQDLADLFAYLARAQPPRRVFDGNAPAVVQAEGFRGEFWLLASNCQVYGSTLRFESGLGNLGFWQSPDDHALWDLDVDRQGPYRLSLDYACPGDTAGNAFVVEVAGQRFCGRVPPTGNWETYEELVLGEVSLPAGRQQLVVRPDGPPSGFLMDLRAVRLRPIDGGP